MKKTQGRPGIAMIELIFSIVIIGIVLMSIPTLIKTAQTSGIVAIQQEAINEAATHLNMVMGYHWDEACTDDHFLDPIVSVTAGDAELNEYNGSGRRMGTPHASKRSFLRADGSRMAASSIGSDEGRGNEDDVDDFDGTSYHLTYETDAKVTYTRENDYVETGTDILIATSVTYGTDTPTTGNYRTSASVSFPLPTHATTGTTNIKNITVTLQDNSSITELSKKIILRAFSCNIGATDLATRSF